MSQKESRIQAKNPDAAFPMSQKGRFSLTHFSF